VNPHPLSTPVLQTPWKPQDVIVRPGAFKSAARRYAVECLITFCKEANSWEGITLPEAYEAQPSHPQDAVREGFDVLAAEGLFNLAMEARGWVFYATPALISRLMAN